MLAPADRNGVPVREAGALRDDREHRGRQPAQVELCLVIGDVDELSTTPLAAEMSRPRLQVGHRLPGRAMQGVRLGRLQARRERVVDEEPPDLLERDVPDELLDVDAAVAQRAAFPVGFGDLRLEGNDSLESGLEVVHRPEST